MTLYELFDDINGEICDWWEKTSVDDFMEGNRPDATKVIDKLREQGIELNLDAKIDK